MGMLPAPPEGYELLPPAEDEPVTPENAVFRAPDGDTVTFTELVAAGLIPTQ